MDTTTTTKKWQPDGKKVKSKTITENSTFLQKKSQQYQKSHCPFWVSGVGGWGCKFRTLYKSLLLWGVHLGWYTFSWCTQLEKNWKLPSLLEQSHFESGSPLQPSLHSQSGCPLTMPWNNCMHINSWTFLYLANGIFATVWHAFLIHTNRW